MYIHVKVSAGMHKESFVSKSTDHFVVTLREKAERNAANKRVVELVAAHFNTTPSNVHIVNGHQNPSKLIEITIAVST